MDLEQESLRKSYVKAGFVRNGIGPDETCCNVNQMIDVSARKRC